MTTEELQRLVELYDAGQAYDGQKETLERQRAKLARELIAARRVVGAARILMDPDGEATTHEEAEVELLEMQAALSAYEEAKG